MPSHLSLNELLHAASRTFALGIDMLPEPLRSEIETAYADAVDIGDGDGEFLIKLVGSADDDDDDYADEIESDAQFMRLT